MTTTPGDRDTTEWRLDANCRTADPELFYPIADRAARRRPQVREAARYCQDCPVIRECLTDAIERGEKWAVRAGLDFAVPSQRRRAAELVGGTPPDSRAQASFTRRQLRRAERVEIDGKMVHPQADHGTIHGYKTYECRCTHAAMPTAGSCSSNAQRAAPRLTPEPMLFDPPPPEPRYCWVCERTLVPPPVCGTHCHQEDTP